MSKQYDNLVERLGEEGAKDYMKYLRGKVKAPGFANMDKTRLKEIAKLGAKARHKQETPPDGLEQSQDRPG